MANRPRRMPSEVMAKEGGPAQRDFGLHRVPFFIERVRTTDFRLAKPARNAPGECESNGGSGHRRNKLGNNRLVGIR